MGIAKKIQELEKEIKNLNNRLNVIENKRKALRISINERARKENEDKKVVQGLLPLKCKIETIISKSAIINNPMDEIWNGEYKIYYINYVDEYGATRFTWFGFLNGEYKIANTDPTKFNDKMSKCLLWEIGKEDFDMYNFDNFSEFTDQERMYLIMYMFGGDKIFCNRSIRQFVHRLDDTDA